MKKLFTLVLLTLAFSSAFSQSNVPNGDFENWYNVVVSASLNYDDLGTNPADNWMGTLNSLALVPATAGGPGPVTVTKTTDKYSGTYAAKAVSQIFPLGYTTVFIPGMIGTAIMDMANVRAILGKPCPDCRPLNFKGYYKFTPVNNDSCAAVILLSKWNATTHKRDTIGYGKMVEHNAVNTYTPFDIPVNYLKTGVVDSMTLLVVSSAGFNVINFMGGVGQVGSTMYADGLTLDYPLGVQQILMSDMRVTTYPNPASDLLNVELSRPVENGSFEIYNAVGQKVGSHQTQQVKNTISVSTLTNGTYFFRFMEGKKIMNTGSFVINK